MDKKPTKKQLLEVKKVLEFKVTNRSNRLKELKENKAPHEMIKTEVQMINQAKKELKDVQQQLKEYE